MKNFKTRKTDDFSATRNSLCVTIEAVRKLYRDQLYSSDGLTEEFKSILEATRNTPVCLDYDVLIQGQDTVQGFKVSNYKLLYDGNVQATVFNGAQTDLQFALKCSQDICLIDDIIEPQNGMIGGSVKEYLKNCINKINN